MQLKSIVTVGALVAASLAAGASPTARADALARGVQAPPTPQHRPAVVTPHRSDKGREAYDQAMAAWRASEANGKDALREQRAAAREKSSDATLSALSSDPGTVTQGAPGNGNYAATPMSPSSSWTAGGSSGSFTWSYPFKSPPTAAGPVPSMAMTYDSGRTDGRTFTTNNQPSVLGEGFELTSSYIERSYLSCHDDGHDSSYDLCWRGERLTLVLNGNSNLLIFAGADNDGADTFRLQHDDGTVVTRGDSANNGDNNGEYWLLRTADGTRYSFGLNRLPGWSAGADETNSTWTVPVFSDDAGDPAQADACAKATFEASYCQQAWRWNLDLVEDVDGNAATYWYAAESNYYARNGHEADSSLYQRGGYLTRIDYGLRAGQLFSGSDRSPAPQQMVLGYSERCLQNCSNLNKDTKEYWPDVPFDSICNKDAVCKSESNVVDAAPTFFTRKRLTQVKTSILNGDGTRRAVDSWAIDHKFFDPGDGGDTTDEILWPLSITHTGEAGPDSIAENPVYLVDTLDEAMRNRVDSSSDGIAPLVRPRLSRVITEAGGTIDVTYSSQDCSPTDLPSPATNKRRCYPVYWAPYGGDPKPDPDWFNKFVVTHVAETDTTSGDVINTSYIYGDGDNNSDDAAWHFSDDFLRADAYRTWSEWRGYSKVTTLVGVGDAPTRAASVTIFMRGMDGDRDGSGGTKNVDVVGLHAGAISDKDQYSGFIRETATYDGRAKDGTYGPLIGGKVNTPWSRSDHSEQFPGGLIDSKTASAVTVKSWITQNQTVNTWTRVTSDPSGPYTRSTTTTVDPNSFDAYGMPTLTHTYSTAVDGVSGNANHACTRTWYARNIGANIITPVARTLQTATTCDGQDAATYPADSSQPGDVISDTSSLYDGAASWKDQVPIAGHPTAKRRASGYDASQTPDYDLPSWQLVQAETYDDLGRVKSVQDAQGATTTTTYTPVGAGVPKSVVTTNDLGHKVTTAVDAAWMVPTKVTDANNMPTETTYDALGRVTGIWTPMASRLLDAPPIYKFEYHTGGTKQPNGFVDPSWVKTSVTVGNDTNYATTYQIYDALLRPRQTQAPSPAGGRILTDTRYNDRGLVSMTTRDIWDNDTAPNSDWVQLASGAGVQDTTTYDGASRPISVTTAFTKTEFYPDPVNPTAQAASRTTTTTYTGDAVTVEPSTGGSATATITDALGRTVETRQYPSNVAGSSYLATKTSYDARGRMATLTSPDGSQFTYAYDLFGRQIKSTDPDRGATTTSYDSLDRVKSTVDSMNRTLAYSYDTLGRKTGMYSSTSLAPTSQLAGWTYDTVAKGQVSSSTRYVGGADGDAYTKKVLSYNELYQPKETQLVLPSTEPLVTIPDANAKIPQTLDFRTSYNRDGTVQGTTEPAFGGLPLEGVTYTYTGLGLPKGITGASGVVLDTSYTPFADPEMMTLGVSVSNNNRVWLTSFYDGLRRLGRFESVVTNETSHLIDLAYSYDNADKITRITDNSATAPDYQCFSYDGYQRLTHAWTPKTKDCTVGLRAPSNIGGGGSYWYTYGYDNDSSLRTSFTKHPIVSGGASTTTTYTYAGTCSSGAVGPHVLTKTDTGPTGGTPTDSDSYCADKAGETTVAEAPGVGTAQSMTWYYEGKLKTFTQGAIKYTNIYDADGNLLIRRPTDSTVSGTTTLFMGSSEVAVTKTVSTTTSYASQGRRYYSQAGRVVGVRVGDAATKASKLTFLAGDNHGTMSAKWEAAAPTTTGTKRYTDPFGNARGTASDPAWADPKRFLGATYDKNTGLAHVGARDYSSDTGRFLSVDPVLDTTDPLSLNGYSYADNSPVIKSDPSGLNAADSGGYKTGFCSTCDPGCDLNCGAATGDWQDLITPDTDDPLGDLFRGGHDAFTSWSGARDAVAGVGAAAAGLGDMNVGCLGFGMCASSAYESAEQVLGVDTESNAHMFGKFSGDVCIAVCTLGLGGGEAAGAKATAGILGRVFGRTGKATEEVAVEAVDEVGGLFRGVPHGHPGYDDAAQGIARPRGGHADPARHNGGNTASEFTSWSTDESIAREVAAEGNGPGIVLRIPDADGPGYSRVPSPDVYGESEVLIQGPVLNAEVLPWEPWS